MTTWRALYPFASNHHRLPGDHQLHYLDEGSGCPVVMLHGNPTWSFFYRDLVRVLSPEFRCIVPDHIGCGYSDKPDDNYPYTLSRHVANLDNLLSALNVRQFHLVVHDWGGAIGMALAARDPARIRSLTVFNTAAFPFARIPLRIAACRLPLIGKAMVRRANAFAWAATRMTTVRPLPLAVKQGFLAPYDSPANRIATHRFVVDIPMGPRHPSYPELLRAEQGVQAMSDKPVRIIWGMRDWCFDASVLAEWRKRLPRAQVSTWEDAGHYLLEDRGAQIIPAVHQFLRDVSAEPASCDASSS